MRGLFCTYEKTAVAIEYFEIVGLDEVEGFLQLTRLPISEWLALLRSLRGLFCTRTYEKTAVLTEYFEIVGLEEVEVILPLTRLPISEWHYAGEK